MNESDKKELADAFNKVARNMCGVICAFEYDRKRHKFEEAYKELFKRREDLELQAKQNRFKFVEVPPGPGETRIWAEFELQELNTNTTSIDRRSCGKLLEE